MGSHTNLTLAGSGGGNPNGFLAQSIPSDFIQPQIYNTPNLTLAGSKMPVGSPDSLALNFGNQGSGGMDWSNALSNFSMGAEGVMGLAGAYNAYKQMGLMEDQLNTQKNVTNRNISNQAKTTNRMLDDRASMAAQLTSGADYGTPEYLKAKEKLQTRVDGSRVA